MFEDREEAGYVLSQKLAHFKKKKYVIVLGIPRGGVVVAKVIAENLQLTLDIVVTKKIGAPNQEELAIGAVGPEGVIVLDSKLINDLQVDNEYIEVKAREKSDEIVERLIKFRGTKDLDLKNKTAILVDDGIATGATVEAAVNYLRKKEVGNIVLAVPVAPKSTIAKFEKLVDKLIVLNSPVAFNSVGQYYRNFPQVTDEEVLRFLRKGKP